MEETGTGDFAQDTARVLRQTPGQIGPGLAIEGAFRVEEVSAIEDATHHIPLGEAEGVITDRVEHAPIDLTMGLGAGGAGRAMPELRRSRGRRCPLGQLLSWSVTQSVVQPDRAEPAIPFGVRHSHLLRPARRELRHPLDVQQPCRCDDGPLG